MSSARHTKKRRQQLVLQSGLLQQVTLQVQCWSRGFNMRLMHHMFGGPISSLHNGSCAIHSGFSIRPVDHFCPPQPPENGPLFEIFNINPRRFFGPFSRPVLGNNIIMQNKEINWSTLFVHFIGPPSLAKILRGHGGGHGSSSVVQARAHSKCRHHQKSANFHPGAVDFQTA